MMAQWLRKIKLNPEWDKAKDGDISIHELAGVIAKRLRAISPLGGEAPDETMDDERDEIAEEFESLAQDQSATTADFDYVMDRLFDWGDTSLDEKWNGKKACWIDTISA